MGASDASKDAVNVASYDTVIAHVIAIVLESTTILDESFALDVYRLAGQIVGDRPSDLVMQSIWRESHRLLYTCSNIKRSAISYEVRIRAWRLFVDPVSFSLLIFAQDLQQREVDFIGLHYFCTASQIMWNTWRYLRLPSDQSVLPSIPVDQEACRLRSLVLHYCIDRKS